ncbi:GH25 family lysozyme [Streptomyces sp.]|uniref:GH25 family lysozyme n=1 Tax=Streptomyces sp. TaxID=1931 RepID=UPI002F3FC2D7
MPTYRSRSPKSRWRGATLTAVVAAVFALLMTMTGAATAASSPSGARIQPGEAYMGAGTRAHQGGAPGDTAGVITPLSQTDGVQGIDVSHWQGSINWTAVRNFGIQFAWIKATEGTSYKDSAFNANYLNAYNAGVIRGAYHFARPDISSGATQANYFASNGGAWSRDNLTLPGVLDIEYNPYGATCYGLSTSAMRTWITDFYNTYKARTTRDAVIYSTANWWNTCTGSWTGMATKSPLFVAHYTTATSPTIPAGWPTWTVWQYTSTGSVSGVAGNVDRDKFNGTRDRLLALANNTP